jgi:hypothetical protein
MMKVRRSSRGFRNRRAPRLPHERDESPQSEACGEHGPRDRIRQAARDVERGLIDTEARGTPSNVPGPIRRQRRRGP